ncbi:PaaI family thioesterase [Paludisphaera rhizosphaerae]|uniref:PaaI family thioesterase n=1 Tax=Paludisphaera rhizosphaerae TaxID=2711216 RepID=UPI0013ED03F7|nr:PaaI family thioesterase [Paludisphaera rhizosphaerae]
MSSILERGLKILAGELPAPPAMQLLGIVARELEPGRAVFELAADARHHNPMGTLHGGVYCDLADAAMAMAYGATLADGESMTTVELKMQFLRPVRTALLTAEARVVQATSSIGYTECEIRDARGRLMAKASSTCMRLSKTGRRSEGRPNAAESPDELPRKPD